MNDARIEIKGKQGMIGRLSQLFVIVWLASSALVAQDAEPAGSASGGASASAADSPTSPASSVTSNHTPLPGSKLPVEQNRCYQCHSDPDPILWQGDKRRFIVLQDTLVHDVHWNSGVVCHDCHGGDPSGQEFSQVHNKANGFRAKLDEIEQSCARCHQQTMIDVTRRSVHAKAGPKNLRGEGTALQCNACHGEIKHGLVSHRLPESPVFAARQATKCGECHPGELTTYQASVHGPAVVKGDVSKTATCASCHGAHDIFRTPDHRSKLFEKNVGQTCGKCHAGLEEQLSQSVHGIALEKRIAESKEEASTLTMRKPVCTSCHLRHELPAATEPPLLTDETHSTGCGNCHAKLASRKLLAHHAERTADGLVSAAECSDCHGAHAITKLEDPASPLAPSNRLATCQDCHTDAHAHAVANFADFNPHANYKDHEKSPGMHFAHLWIETFVLVGLLFFVFHTVFWILRATLHLLLHGPHPQAREGEPAIIRFSKLHCFFRNSLMMTLIGLAITGLVLRYWTQPWAQVVGGSVGGFRVFRNVHLVFGLLMLICCTVYGGWLVQLWVKSRRTFSLGAMFGPDSPIPNFQDAREMMGMFRWFFGLGDKPKFDRWTFWEKFDYWAVVFIVTVIGGSGLLMWWPNLFARLVPGSWINMGQMLHYDTALMATTFALAIRFINTHFRPEKFPMDLSVITGLVSERHLENARPQFLARLRQQGQLDALRTVMPSKRRIWLLIVGAGIVQVVGLVLLAVTLFASLEG